MVDPGTGPQPIPANTPQPPDAPPPGGASLFDPQLIQTVAQQIGADPGLVEEALLGLPEEAQQAIAGGAVPLPVVVDVVRQILEAVGLGPGAGGGAPRDDAGANWPPPGGEPGRVAPDQPPPPPATGGAPPFAAPGAMPPGAPTGPPAFAAPGALPPPPAEAMPPPPDPGLAAPPAPAEPAPPAAREKRTKATKTKKRSTYRWRARELPPDRWDGKGPGYQDVLDMLQRGRARYQSRNDHARECHEMYHLVDDGEKFGGGPASPTDGELTHVGSQPATFTDRIVTLVAPRLGRIRSSVGAAGDDDKTRASAQAMQNYYRYFLLQLARDYNRETSRGNPQPIWERKVGGLAAIDGNLAFLLDIDPGNPEFPWIVEPIPITEVYPLHEGVIRDIRMPLRDAMAYPEIRRALPRDSWDKRGRRGPTGDELISIVGYSDERWWCLAWDWFGGDANSPWRKQEGKAAAAQGRWIQKPVEHRMGWPRYFVPNSWNGTPVVPLWGGDDDYTRYSSRGVLSSLLPTFRVTNQIRGAAATGLFKAIDPVTVFKLAQDRAQRQLKLPNPDYDQVNKVGGKIVLYSDEDMRQLINDVAATEQGRVFLQSLLSDLGDAMPPVQAGRGQLNSGFERFQANEAAGALNVQPIQNFLETVLEQVGEWMFEQSWRFGQGEDRLFTKLPFRTGGHAEDDPLGLAQLNLAADFTADDVARNGPFVRVTFDRFTLTEKMQLAQLNLLLVKDKLRSRLSAMEDVGTDDVSREFARIFMEWSLDDPGVAKAAIKAALVKASGEELDDEGLAQVMADAWEEARMLEAQQPKGLPGMAAPGGAAPPPSPMPGVPAPGLPPVMAGAA